MYHAEYPQTQPINTVPGGYPGRRHRGVALVVALVALVVAGATAGVATLLSRSSDPVAVAPGPATKIPPGTIVLDDAPGPVQPVGFPVGGKAQGSGNGPSTDPPPAQPCDGADPTKLVVLPDPVKLGPGASKGSLAIHNCGQQNIDWSAQSTPWVTLSPASGLLAGGATKTIGLTVDLSTLAVGPYSFKVKVSQPGHNVYVDVHGTKLVQGLALTPPDPTPGPTVGSLAGGKPAGCAAMCITKAWLTPKPASPDLNLEVKTHTAARIVAAVDQNAPKIDQNGRPYFVQPDVTMTTGQQQYRTQWTTTLKPLKAGTLYHIIVRAVDSQGGLSIQASTFKTAKPATGLSAGEAGGCSAGCVKSALLVPVPGSPDMELRVQTHVPATMSAYLDDAKPQTNGAGEPYFPGQSPAATTGGQLRTQWTVTFELEHATTYHIILKVTDEDPRSRFQQASFTTKPKPATSHHNKVLITFHKIFVSDDADNAFLNWRGEMRFMFEVAGERRGELDLDERKVNAPETIDLGGDRSGRGVVIDNAPDSLTIRVQAWERDASSTAFCSIGDFMFDEASGREKIDGCFTAEWNTAVGTVDLHANEGGGALPPCYGFSFTADICALLSATGDDPRFDVFVAVDFLD